MSDSDDVTGCFGCCAVIIAACLTLVVVKFTWNYLFS